MLRGCIFFVLKVSVVNKNRKIITINQIKQTKQLKTTQQIYNPIKTNKIPANKNTNTS